ncbi:MAG: methyltransferase domain-containing protein [Steroidobacteraceae bacterium]
MSGSLTVASPVARREPVSERPDGAPATPTPRKLSARLEPFDSYWQAPEDVDSGYASFSAYYRANYLAHLPQDRNARILVISCGPGYLVNLLAQTGYRNVVGIDSDERKVAHALARSLPCETAEAFPYLEQRQSAELDVIIPEQELNHLTLDETVDFLRLCRGALRPGGRIIVYAMNGANPLVGSENIAHNIDHFYNVTEHSLGQILSLGGFDQIKAFALKLYVFWKNPLNYVGLFVTAALELAMRVIFILYGKKVRVVSKKIAAIAFKPG